MKFTVEPGDFDIMVGNSSIDLQTVGLTVESFICPVQKKSVQWQKADVFNPAVIVRDGKVYLLFRAEDNYGTADSFVGVAVH